MTLTPDRRLLLLRMIVNGLDQLLCDRLPAGAADTKPPPDWPWWQECYRLMDCKHAIVMILEDHERTAA